MFYFSLYMYFLGLGLDINLLKYFQIANGKCGNIFQNWYIYSVSFYLDMLLRSPSLKTEVQYNTLMNKCEICFKMPVDLSMFCVFCTIWKVSFDYFAMDKRHFLFITQVISRSQAPWKVTNDDFRGFCSLRFSSPYQLVMLWLLTMLEKPDRSMWFNDENSGREKYIVNVTLCGCNTPIKVPDRKSVV